MSTDLLVKVILLVYLMVFTVVLRHVIEFNESVRVSTFDVFKEGLPELVFRKLKFLWTLAFGEVRL